LRTRHPPLFFQEVPTARRGGIGPHVPTRSDAEVQVLGRIAPELVMGACVHQPHLAERVQALMDRLNKEDSGDRNVLVEEF
jgi:hypothetical protein